MLKTTDGGLSWKEMDSGTFETLNSLSFPDSTIGYCAGNNGILLKLIEDIMVQQVSKIEISTTKLCAGTSYPVSFAVNKKFNSDNTFTAYLSNAAGEYNSRGIIGTLKSDTSGIISITIPANTPLNLGYRIRIQSSSPESTSPNNDSYIEIHPSTTPTISIATANTTVCEGTEVSLTSKITNGGNTPKINWYSNNQLLSSLPSLKITPKDKAEYWARIKSNAVCATPDSATSNAIVFKVTSPTKPVVNMIGNTLSSSSATGNQWYKGTERIPLATTPTYQVLENGLYMVGVNDGVCPIQFSAEINVVITGNEIENETSAMLSLYPNPTNGILNLKTSLELSKICVYQNNGTKILESKAIESLDVSALPEGLYLLEVWDISGTRILKKLEKR